ncbi:MAG: hypothetical protein IJ811_01625 [Clostridia bacterium]|nr:hypothetical protein [Clostridia bacterium]
MTKRALPAADGYFITGVGAERRIGISKNGVCLIEDDNGEFLPIAYGHQVETAKNDRLIVRNGQSVRTVVL